MKLLLRKISFYLIIAISLLLFGCDTGEDITVPENLPETFHITPEGQVIEFNNIRLEIPAGAVNETWTITFEYNDLCNQESYYIYLFRCLVPAINPSGLKFNKPVRLTITEDLYWIKIEDRDGRPVTFDEEKILIYETTGYPDNPDELSDCSVEYIEDKIVVSADIEKFGSYQIGINWEDVDIKRDLAKIWIYFSENDSIYYEIRSFYKSFSQYFYNFLSEDRYFQTLLYNEAGTEEASLQARINGAGTYEHIWGSDEYFFTRFQDIYDNWYSVINEQGETALLNIITFDRDARLVEGNFRAPGLMVRQYTEYYWWVEIKAEFSVQLNEEFY